MTSKTCSFKKTKRFYLCKSLILNMGSLGVRANCLASENKLEDELIHELFH